jgi:hypothetical protein
VHELPNLFQGSSALDHGFDLSAGVLVERHGRGFAAELGAAAETGKISDRMRG